LNRFVITYSSNNLIWIILPYIIVLICIMVNLQLLTHELKMIGNYLFTGALNSLLIYSIIMIIVLLKTLYVNAALIYTMLEGVKINELHRISSMLKISFVSAIILIIAYIHNYSVLIRSLGVSLFAYLHFKINNFLTSKVLKRIIIGQILFYIIVFFLTWRSK